MDLQYISDSKGNPKSVIIPIDDWNRIKQKYDGIEKDIQQDWYDLLSQEDKEAIEIGLQQANSGHTIPHSEVMQSVKNKIEQLKK